MSRPALQNLPHLPTPRIYRCVDYLIKKYKRVSEALGFSTEDTCEYITALRTCEIFINRATPVKPSYDDRFSNMLVYCPVCVTVLGGGCELPENNELNKMSRHYLQTTHFRKLSQRYHYCPNCGQAFDWAWVDEFDKSIYTSLEK